MITYAAFILVGCIACLLSANIDDDDFIGSLFRIFGYVAIFAGILGMIFLYATPECSTLKGADYIRACG